MRVLSTIFILLTFLTAGGCVVATPKYQQMYPGEPLPADKTSRIKGAGEVKLTMVDGADVGLAFIASSNIAVVLPGKHVVTGTYIPNASLKLSVEAFRLEFVSRAGVDYLIDITPQSPTPQIFEDTDERLDQN